MNYRLLEQDEIMCETDEWDCYYLDEESTFIKIYSHDVFCGSKVSFGFDLIVRRPIMNKDLTNDLILKQTIGEDKYYVKNQSH